MKSRLTHLRWKAAGKCALALYALVTISAFADSLVTNTVTFQVDMSAQVRGISSSNENVRNTPVVSCTGTFNDWDTHSFLLTNDPAASNPELYSGTVTIVGRPGTRLEYRFFFYIHSTRGDLPGVRFSYGYTLEQPLSTGGGNRSFNLLTTNGSLVLPAARFGDLQPSDMLPDSAVVRFNVDMAGAIGANGHVFNPSTDRVYVNGDFVRWVQCGLSGGVNVGWSPWDSCTLGPQHYQLTNVPGTRVYTVALTLSQPNAVALTYRYTINGDDNEPTGGTNHVRYVRQTGEYAMPLDTFGVPYQEPSFGDLSVTRSVPGQIRISWLGRPGLRLQSCTSPTDGSWQDHPETDGLSSTNWPNAGSQRFFRLIKP